MANRTYLLAVDDRTTTWSDDPEREIIAEGIGEIPVFWAGLFAPGEQQLDPYKDEDGEGDDAEILIPNWCVASATAKPRLAALRGPIGDLLRGRARDVWFAFVDHLAGVEAAYLKTNAAELWGLGPEGFGPYLATLHRPFAEPTPENLRAAVEANGLAFEDGALSWDDDEETTCKLAGADHIAAVPWLDS